MTMNENKFKEEGLKYQKILKLEGESVEFIYDKRGGRSTGNSLKIKLFYGFHGSSSSYSNWIFPIFKQLKKLVPPLSKE